MAGVAAAIPSYHYPRLPQCVHRVRGKEMKAVFIDNVSIESRMKVGKFRQMGVTSWTDH